jgi:hypothetical protein
MNAKKAKKMKLYTSIEYQGEMRGGGGKDKA